MLKPTVPTFYRYLQSLLPKLCVVLLTIDASFGWAETNIAPIHSGTLRPGQLQSFDPKAPGYRPKPDTDNDAWLKRPMAHLELAQHCMKQTAMSTDLMERVIRFAHARGSMSVRDIHEHIEKLKTPAGQAALVQLTPAQITQSFKDMGLTLDPTGFTAATYTVPGRSVFYAIKGSDSCVLDIKTPSASLEPILSWGCGPVNTTAHLAFSVTKSCFRVSSKKWTRSTFALCRPPGKTISSPVALLCGVDSNVKCDSHF
jgi:hypothetical protein